VAIVAVTARIGTTSAAEQDTVERLEKERTDRLEERLEQREEERESRERR
jgi:membrane protein YdbS with pleckstrin-like domain